MFMTPEEKSLLERTYKIAEENNTILCSMRRSARVTNILRATYWIIIIVTSFGAYYFIQPYVNTLMGSLGSLQNLTGNLDTANSTAQSFKDLFK
jgi:hypothetical protein